MEVTRLYLVRHGQSAGNAEGRFGGHSATPLSALGRQQALATAKALAKERVAAIYSSDLLRAVQTAEPLAEILNLKINATDAFRERHVGVLEGLTFDEAKNQFPQDYYALVNRELAHVITSGESYNQLLDRTTGVLRQILQKHRGQRVAVFAHTGTICFLTLHIIGAIHDHTTHTPWLVTSNCGINRFEFRGGSMNNVRIVALNDTRHLIQITGNDAFAAR
jgi:2,3-bisphosphoglycerate-dependent phosphoglycerate mutase